jgi:hypothetical protein
MRDTADELPARDTVDEYVYIALRDHTQDEKSRNDDLADVAQTVSPNARMRSGRRGGELTVKREGRCYCGCQLRGHASGLLD